MATEYNIIQKQYNGTDYDTLYPQTTSQQVLLNDNTISYTGDATVNGALTKQQTDISQLNSKISGEANALSAVPTSYDANYVLRYNSKQIGPANYANSAFVLFVQSSASLNRSAIFSVLIGADSSACAYELLAGSNPAHDLGFTASGNLYIKSLTSSAVRADVTIFKTR